MKTKPLYLQRLQLSIGDVSTNYQTSIHIRMNIRSVTMQGINETWGDAEWTVRRENTTSTMIEGFLNVSSQFPQPSDSLRFICETVICMPIAILGVLGNSLAFVILWRQKQRMNTSFLLQGLAVTDTLILTATILLRSIRYLYVFTQAPGLEPYTAAYPYIFVWVYPCVYFLRLADGLLTVLLTIDRFIAVRHPLKAQAWTTFAKTVRNMIIFTLIALLFSIPRFFEYKVDLQDPNGHGFIGTSLLQNGYYTVIYRLTLYLLFMYLLPMILLVVLNAKLLNTLREADNYRASVSEWRMRRANRNLTAVVVTVVLATIICNSTALITHLIWSLQLLFPKLRHLETSRRYLALISNIFITINSAINFIIYCLCSRNFTVILVRMCRCGMLRPKKRGKLSSSRTTFISLAHHSRLKRRSNLPRGVQNGI